MKHDSNSYGLVMACNRAFKSQKLCKINHNVSDTVKYQTQYFSLDKYIQ